MLTRFQKLSLRPTRQRPHAATQGENLLSSDCVRCGVWVAARRLAFQLVKPPLKLNLRLNLGLNLEPNLSPYRNAVFCIYRGNSIRCPM